MIVSLPVFRQDTLVDNRCLYDKPYLNPLQIIGVLQILSNRIVTFTRVSTIRINKLVGLWEIESQFLRS